MLFRSMGIESKYQYATNIYTKKGCPWMAMRDGGCIFCGTNYPHISYRKPEHIWEEIIYLQDTFNIEFVWDVSDDIGGNVPWLKKLVEKKPSNSPFFRFYLSAKNANRETIELLKKLNCIDIFVGFESYNDDILSQMNKQATTEDNRRTVDLLTEFEIPTTASFILGNYGETEDSIIETYKFAKEIRSLPIIRSIHFSIFKPVPGAKAFDILCDNSKNDFKSLDIFNNHQLQKEWVERFCYVSYESLLEFQKKFSEIDPCIVEYGPIDYRCHL